MTEEQQAEAAPVETGPNPKKLSAAGGLAGTVMGARRGRTAALVGGLIGGTIGYVTASLFGSSETAADEGVESTGEPVVVTVAEDESAEDETTD